MYRGKVFDLIVDRVEYPSGNTGVREIAHHPGGAVVVPLLDDGRVLLVKQLRYPFGRHIVEVRAGKLSPGEEPRVAAARELEEETGIRINDITSKDVISVVERWKKSVVELDNLLYEDARKEFTLSSMTGFGIDGGAEVKKLDFEQVRGEFESNSVVAAIQEHIKQKAALADELINRLKRIR